MRTSRTIFTMTLASLVILTGAPAVQAAKTIHTIAESRTIENEGGEARILLDFDGLEELVGRWVVSAFLSIPLAESNLSSELQFQVCSVSTEWRGRGATWTTPGERAGGDFDAQSPYLTVEEGTSTGSVRVNVTDEVRSMIHGVHPFHGLAVTVPAWRGEGLTSSERTLLGSWSQATLVVSTVGTGPREALQREALQNVEITRE